MNPENIQLIQPPIMIMGSTLVTLPLSMSVIMLGSVIMFWVTAGRFCVKYPVSSLLKNCLRIRNAERGMYLPFSRRRRARIKIWLQNNTQSRSSQRLLYTTINQISFFLETMKLGHDPYTKRISSNTLRRITIAFGSTWANNVQVKIFNNLFNCTSLNQDKYWQRKHLRLCLLYLSCSCWSSTFFCEANKMEI